MQQEGLEAPGLDRFVNQLEGGLLRGIQFVPRADRSLHRDGLRLERENASLCLRSAVEPVGAQPRRDVCAISVGTRPVLRSGLGVGRALADRPGFTPGRCRRPGRPPRDDHLGRAQDAIVEAVADAVDAGDLPLIVDRVLFVDDGLMNMWVEAIALVADLLEALGLKDALQLLADQPDALGPGLFGEVSRDVGEGTLEIVEDRQELGQQAAVGVADLLVGSRAVRRL